MAYRRPAWFVRTVFNPIAMKTGIGGAETLAVTRRRSGGTQEIPVTPIEHEGVRYLVSARGETEWVKNLRAAGGKGRLKGMEISASEVPIPDRAPILERYKVVAGKAVAAHFKALPDPADHPVFRI